jgi:sterol desaturase/sphingolipid hydroxylase (fatty acid hydroxylase superfamily)
LTRLQAFAYSPRVQRNIIWVVSLSGVAVVNVAVLGFVHRYHPFYWAGIRRNVVGPLDGAPLVSVDYLRLLMLAMVIDLLVLRHRSAVFALCRFGVSARVDVVLAALRVFGLGLLMPTLMTAGFVAIIPALVRSWRIDALSWLPSLSDVPNTALKILIYIVVADFLRYWWHRAMHASDLLWRFHAVHHSATSFTILTGNRVHPLEDIVAVPLVIVPLVLLGASTTHVFAVYALMRLIDFAQHSMVPFSYGWCGRWLVYSPVGHRVHHSPEPEHWDLNYGDFMPLWDRLFGTWYEGNRVNEIVGIGDPVVENRGVVASVLMPFAEAAALRSSKTTSDVR